MGVFPSKLQITINENFVEQESYSSRYPEQHIGLWFDRVQARFDPFSSSKPYGSSKTSSFLKTHGFQIESAESKVKFEIKLDNIENGSPRPKFYIGIKLITNNKTEFEKECILVDGTKLKPHYIGYVFDELTKCGVKIVRNGISDTERDGASLKNIADKFVDEDEALKEAAISKSKNIEAAAMCCNGLCCPMIGDFLSSRRSS
jgi:hypothetical protein